MWLREVKKGVSVIKQGELGDNFYVVDKGSFDIFVARDGKDPIKVATRGQ
jgi:CRP-like cAMP-binding protein